MIIAGLLIMMMLCGCYINNHCWFADCDNVMWLYRQWSLPVCWLWWFCVAVTATVSAGLLIVTMLYGCCSNDHCLFADCDDVVWLLQQQSLPVYWLWWCCVAVTATIIAGLLIVMSIVMLIVFIVYRVRKRDEGSYMLDDPTSFIPHQASGYRKALIADQEFYA